MHAQICATSLCWRGSWYGARCLVVLKLGACSAGAWHVLDFGLARRFVDDDGSVIPQRDMKEFRGSTSYASVAAHKLQDLGANLWQHSIDRIHARLHAGLIFSDRSTVIAYTPNIGHLMTPVVA